MNHLPILKIKMGYYTILTLVAYYPDRGVDPEEWDELIKDIDDPDLPRDFLQEIYSENGFSGKSYDTDNDMVKLSLLFPNLLLVLTGKGEDETDRWTESWRNGKRLTYYSEIEKALELNSWLQINYPAIYDQFITIYKQRQHKRYDSISFEIAEPAIPEYNPHLDTSRDNFLGHLAHWVCRHFKISSSFNCTSGQYNLSS